MNSSIEDRLDAKLIREGMTESTRARLRHLTLLQDTDSSNAYVLRLPHDQQHAHAVLAESQKQGKGRRQRSWHSPAGGNIYLSLGWRFEESEYPLSTLPLVEAICVCKALSRAGLADHGIKWPNDILVNGRKLAGILVEMQSAGNGPATVAIGIGVNVRMPDAGSDALKSAIDRPWTDLASRFSAESAVPGRNELVAMILDETLQALELFEASGFEAFRADWENLDLLYGNTVELEQDGQKPAGRARGVDPYGGLLLEGGDGEVRAFHSGEVSVIYG
jgi:BirA family biotin operon repressor/biotin-[acetyl-CoA-carboxylase] ligase